MWRCSSKCTLQAGSCEFKPQSHQKQTYKELRKGAGGVAQAVEHMPSKCEDLS
jgi:hypothetical protein